MQNIAAGPAVVERGAGAQLRKHSCVIAVINREWFLEEPHNLGALVCHGICSHQGRSATSKVRSNNAGLGHGIDPQRLDALLNRRGGLVSPLLPPKQTSADRLCLRRENVVQSINVRKSRVIAAVSQTLGDESYFPQVTRLAPERFPTRPGVIKITER